MGARALVRRRLLEGKRDGFDIEYIGRGYRASPAKATPASTPSSKSASSQRRSPNDRPSSRAQ